jgi:hypothetical protein
MDTCAVAFCGAINVTRLTTRNRMKIFDVAFIILLFNFF